MANKIIKWLSSVVKMTEFTVAKMTKFTVPKMVEFTITKWLSETRKWLTLAPNDWAKTENGWDMWVGARGVSRLMWGCFSSRGVGLLRAHLCVRLVRRRVGSVSCRDGLQSRSARSGACRCERTCAASIQRGSARGLICVIGSVS
jgi:hypothetical protein